MLQEAKEPLITAGWEGVARFFLLYGTVIVGGVLSVRQWIIKPVKEKYDEIAKQVADGQEKATKEHQEIYKEIDRRIGLEPGISVKTMADGIGSRVGAVEVELGRMEVAVDKIESENRTHHEQVIKELRENSNQVSAIGATLKILVGQTMQRIARVADHLGG